MEPRGFIQEMALLLKENKNKKSSVRSRFMGHCTETEREYISSGLVCFI